MRWIWIDKFIAFESRKRAVAVKAVSLAEEHVHDLYPDFPIMPHSLIVEAMAQTGGMLVGEADNFHQKVILAKIARATFHRLIRTGETITFEAEIEQLNEIGASIKGVVRLVRPAALNVDAATAPLGPNPADLAAHPVVAEIDIMFSHIDQNLGGRRFPEENFVFTDAFVDLLRRYRSGLNVTI